MKYNGEKVGKVHCSSSTIQSKIALNVRNLMRKKKGKLWRLDVIIMCGCLGLEDDWIAGSHLCHLSASPPHPRHTAETRSRSYRPGRF